MNKMDVIIGVLISIIIGVGGGGTAGFFIGKQYGNRGVELQLNRQAVDLSRANAKLDSLQALPAKVDTIVEKITLVEVKTDTLILISKQILDNTETIKQDVKTIKQAVCE